jgi:two-component system cell cycle sensor histidine kinase/response regulator CckA
MARVLFVDDDELERTYAQEVLEPRGHEVVFAPDGAAALEIYRNVDARIDVVVTDLKMPRVNGLRLIRELKEWDPRAEIIATSGVNADQLLLAEDYGARILLIKPWHPRDLLAAIDEAARFRIASTRLGWERSWD